jgi:hypothetical protein
MPRDTYCGTVAKFPTSVAFNKFAGYKTNRKVATINLINYQKVLEWPQYPLLKANFDWVPVKA